MASTSGDADKDAKKAVETLPVSPGSAQPSGQLAATITPGVGQQSPDPQDDATPPNAKNPKVVGKTDPKDKKDGLKNVGDKEGKKPPEFKADDWPADFDIIKAIMAMIAAKHSFPVVSTIVMGVVGAGAAVATAAWDVTKGLGAGVAGGVCKAGGALGIPGADERGESLLKSAKAGFGSVGRPILGVLEGVVGGACKLGGALGIPKASEFGGALLQAAAADIQTGDVADVFGKVAGLPIRQWAAPVEQGGSWWHAMYAAQKAAKAAQAEQTELEKSDPNAMPLEVGPADKDKKAPDATPLAVAQKGKSVLDTAAGATGGQPMPLTEPKQPALPIPPGSKSDGDLASCIPPSAEVSPTGTPAVAPGAHEKQAPKLGHS